VPVSGEDGAMVVRVPALPWHANSIGTLHGGVVAAIGELGLREAVVGSLAPPGRATLVDLVVDYLRPVPADGAHVEVRAEIVHRWGRFAVAHGSLTRADGAIAALVRSTTELVEDRGVACSSG
jgi:uncharacterized protein (TIGR00369 family)